MSENKIKVSASTTSKAVRVNVSTPTLQGTVALSQDTSAYNANIAEQWAISENIVLGKDYSSKYYANKAKESASNAQGFANSTKESYYAVLESSENANKELIKTRDEAIANIETSKVEAVDSINSTKTTILSDIEFVADGEKQEINELADVIKDNANTVNIAIEAGVERLNSIDTLKKSQITNCLLEVPQNIKLELNNGTLTLKAGSKVIVPNGANNFDEIITTKDYSVTTTANATCTVYYTATYNKIEAFSGASSSSDADIETKGVVHYNTTANKIIRTNNSGTSQQLSFPIAKIVLSGSTVTEIKEVFQGMGYIGSTIWVDKGVKGLIPNGRNKDGSLKNTEYTTSKVATINMLGNLPTIVSIHTNGTLASSLYYTEQEEQPTGGQTLWYKPSENIMSRISANGTLVRPFYTFVVATNDCTNGVVSNFQPKLPFRAVDSNDFNKTPHITETYVNGTSGYRIWSDKYCEQWGISTGAMPETVTLLKPYKDTNGNILITPKSSSTPTVPAGNPFASWISNSQIRVSSSQNNWAVFWETKGYVA